MTFEDFKDWLFEVLNEMDNDILADIKTNDKANTFGKRKILLRCP